MSRELTNEQTCIFGDNGGCRSGCDYESGLCGNRNAIRSNGRSNPANTAALGTATRGPISGFSFGISQKEGGFVWTYRFPGLRRYHGG